MGRTDVQPPGIGKAETKYVSLSISVAITATSAEGSTVGTPFDMAAEVA
jgi:hypothetical protein